MPFGDFFERSEAKLCAPINMAPRPLSKPPVSFFTRRRGPSHFYPRAPIAGGAVVAARSKRWSGGSTTAADQGIPTASPTRSSRRGVERARPAHMEFSALGRRHRRPRSPCRAGRRLGGEFGPIVTPACAMSRRHNGFRHRRQRFVHSARPRAHISAPRLAPRRRPPPTPYRQRKIGRRSSRC